MRSRGLFVFAIAVCVGVFGGCRSDPPDYKAIDDLPNPGRGWATHSSFISDQQNRYYPASTIAYFRFTWRQAEPTEGGYAFDTMDSLIAQAQSHGQKIAFRIMGDKGEGGVGVPDWLMQKGIKGWSYTGADGTACFSPDAADPTYMSYAQKLIQAFGARYNGSPGVDSVDIGLVGDYGEWHYTLAAPLGAVMPPYDVRTQYIDWYVGAFPDCLLIMLVGDPTQTDSDTLSYALSKGSGWRADCWGDYREPYNHMEDDYPLKLKAPGVADAWRTRPVVLETCGVPQDWYQAYPDRLADALDFAIANHASVLNAKSSQIPEAWITQLSAFTTHIGYRFALAGKPDIPKTAAAGSTISVSLTWTNLGNAPVYKPYTLALRLCAGGVEVSRAQSAADVRTWMPHSADGKDYTESVEISVPTAQSGTLLVQTALLDPGTGKPAIQLAMDGRNPDLWYDIGSTTAQ